MSELNSYINRLETLESDLVDIVKKSIIEKEGYILGMIKLRLYNKGVDGDNKEITPTYSSSTIELKKEKNQRTSHVTLRDSGAFYKSMFLEFKNNNIFIKSNDEKSLSLISKYGESIMALTDEEQEIIIDTIIEPAVINEVKKLNKDIDLF